MKTDILSGILVINKEKGYTSHDVVSVLRGILKMKRIGHTGTLDPNAEGVLPVCLGNATKLVNLLTDGGKEYRARAKFGISTDTEDMTGTVISELEVPVEERPSEEQVKRTLSSFLGGYDQIPPMYSAKKVKGKRLYELARQGLTIEREACFVEIRSLELKCYEFPYFEIEVACGKGTYIRSLIRDIGERIGIPATMDSLKRTAAAGFKLSEALTLDEVRDLAEKGGIDEKIISIESVFSSLPKIQVSGRDDVLLKNGNKLSFDEGLPDGDYRVYTEDDEFAAVYSLSGKTARPKGMFL